MEGSGREWEWEWEWGGEGGGGGERRVEGGESKASGVEFPRHKLCPRGDTLTLAHFTICTSVASECAGECARGRLGTARGRKCVRERDHEGEPAREGESPREGVREGERP